ncbi:hypothetical protein CR513_32367, partial [Mucuna pruriens]
MAMLLEKYGIVHKVATVYYPQTNGQAEGKVIIAHQESHGPGESSWPDRLLPRQTNYVAQQPKGACSLEKQPNQEA